MSVINYLDASTTVQQGQQFCILLQNTVREIGKSVFQKRSRTIGIRAVGSEAYHYTSRAVKSEKRAGNQESKASTLLFSAANLRRIRGELIIFDLGGTFETPFECSYLVLYLPR